MENEAHLSFPAPHRQKKSRAAHLYRTINNVDVEFYTVPFNNVPFIGCGHASLIVGEDLFNAHVFWYSRW